MTARLPFVFGAALALAMLAMVFIGLTAQSVRRPPLVTKPAPPLPPVELRRWEEAPLTPRLVRTIPIVAPPKPAPPPVAIAPNPARNYRAPDVLPPHRYVAPEQPRKRASKREKPAAKGDICRGKGKNYTNNGRSWRCKR